MALNPCHPRTVPQTDPFSGRQTDGSHSLLLLDHSERPATDQEIMNERLQRIFHSEQTQQQSSDIYAHTLNAHKSNLTKQQTQALRIKHHHTQPLCVTNTKREAAKWGSQGKQLEEKRAKTCFMSLSFLSLTPGERGRHAFQK